MKKKTFIASLIGVGIFIIFTILVMTVDVAKIGPNNSAVGLSHMNAWYRDSLANVISSETGMKLYKFTDWGSIPAIILGLVFAVVGLVQWIKRKHILKVDGNILTLGLFYILLLLLFVFFTFVPINYRPVLIDGKLESSYPSSTTLLSIGFMTTAIINNFKYIKKKSYLYTLTFIEILYMLFLIVGRLLSGVHWLSDIIASLILGISLSGVYYALFNLKYYKEKENE